MAKAKAKAKPARKFKSVARKPAPAPKKVHWHGPKMPIITPYLSVRDGIAALAFYEKAFGFKRRFEMKTPEGRLRHGELEHANGVIMVGEPGPDMRGKTPAEVGGTPVSLYVYVPDVDATARAAKSAGATIAQEPTDQFYGDRTCEIRDPEGHSWCFATHVKDVNPEDMKG